MTNCTCHPGHTCTSVESCAAARRAEFGDAADYEKRIREALSDATQGHHSAIVSKADLRALLAELDAVRADAQRYRYLRDVAWGDGSLVYFDQRYDKDEWDAKIDAALKGAAHECR